MLQKFCYYLYLVFITKIGYYIIFTITELNNVLSSLELLIYGVIAIKLVLFRFQIAKLDFKAERSFLLGFSCFL
jgi:hypothetical protein